MLKSKEKQIEELTYQLMEANSKISNYQDRTNQLNKALHEAVLLAWKEMQELGLSEFECEARTYGMLEGQAKLRFKK